MEKREEIKLCEKQLITSFILRNLRKLINQLIIQKEKKLNDTI